MLFPRPRLALPGNAADHAAMRRLVLVLVFAIGLSVPAFAFGSDSPDPAAICKAEYLSLGADAFKAKYGTEAYGNCVAQHGGTTPTTTTTVPRTTTTKTTELPTGNDPAS